MATKMTTDEKIIKFGDKWLMHEWSTGTGTVCPLAKFNCQVDKRSPFEIPAEENLTIDDCWTFCAQCEHAEVQADGSVFLKDFETHCLDCPVKAALDGLTESAAGAFC